MMYALLVHAYVYIPTLYRLIKINFVLGLSHNTIVLSIMSF